MVDLIQRIQEEAYVVDNQIVKVDHFINQHVDTKMVFDIGHEFALAYPNATKILTIESSGIAFGVATAFHLGNAPIVFARKDASQDLSDDLYESPIVSFTKHDNMHVTVNKTLLSEGDRVVIIDDFLSTGSALWALVNLVRQSGATIEGVGIVIEKTYLNARRAFEAEGIRIHSLANITDIIGNRVILGKSM